MKIVVLGAGNVGRHIVEDLLCYYPDVDEVVVGDISLKAAEEAVKRDLSRAKALKIDVTKKDQVRSILKGADSLINATFYRYAIDIINVALEKHVPYIDLGSSLYNMHKMFEEAGVPGVIDAGGAPGVINMLSKYLVEKMDTAEYIHLYDVAVEEEASCKSFPLRWKYSVETMLDEVVMDAVVYRGGKFVKVPPFSGLEERVFPDPIGKNKVFHIYHPEVKTLAWAYGDKGLNEVWYKIDSFNLPWEDGMKWKFLADIGLARNELVEVEGVRISPRKLFLKLLRSLPEVEEVWEGYEMLQSVVKGLYNGQEVVAEATAISHVTSETGSILTSSPAAIVGYWLAKGILDKPGAYPVEQVLDTELFFKELLRRDVKLFYRESRDLM